MRKRFHQLQRYLEHDLWQGAATANQEREKPSWRTQLLRILSLTYEGVGENQLLIRASSLAYASLIGLGPLVAIVVMVTSWGIESAEPAQRIKELLLFVAPNLQQLPAEEFDAILTEVVTGAQAMLDRVNTGGRGALGIIGIAVLIFVGINLLTSIEKTFNAVWGVKRGRDWSQRIVSYWAFLSLGALLGLGSTALFTATALTGFFDWLPFGQTLTAFIITLTPVIAALMLVVLLSFGYQFFPNTTVHFRPALYGAGATVVALLLNNYLSVLYVSKVIQLRSVFGSLGILLVLMFGLYFFWLFILVGAQLTYAVQNVNFLTHREVWKSISVRTQEMVTLAAFLLIARRFHECLPPPRSGDLSEELRVPGNVLNTSLGMLCDQGWITPIRQVDDDGMEETHYRPAMPLSRYSLARFREVFANHGNSTGVDFVSHSDPLLERYLEHVARAGPEEEDTESFDRLFNHSRREER
jgi:membrane protein